MKNTLKNMSVYFGGGAVIALLAVGAQRLGLAVLIVSVTLVMGTTCWIMDARRGTQEWLRPQPVRSRR